MQRQQAWDLSWAVLQTILPCPADLGQEILEEASEQYLSALRDLGLSCQEDLYSTLRCYRSKPSCRCWRVCPDFLSLICLKMV